jgi:hypothetical protein
MRPLLLVGILSCAACFAGDDEVAPQMNTLSTKSAKPGELFTINGVGLNNSKIDEIFLTDHKFDMKVKVIEQKDTSMTLRVPPFAKPGRMQVLVLTKGDDPKLLEQPLYILIEDATTEVSQAKPPEPVKAPPQQDKQ